MPWRNLHQQRKEQERARINSAAMRELARRHRDEFEQIRRDMTAATAATEANATGKRVQPPVAALGAVVPTDSSSSPRASSSDPAGRTPGSRSDGSTDMTKGAACDSALVETTTA